MKPWELNGFTALSKDEKVVFLYLWICQKGATVQEISANVSFDAMPALSKLAQKNFIRLNGFSASAIKRRTKKKKSDDDVLERFWSVYPKKEGREEFEKYFRKLRADADEKERIVVAAEKYAAYCTAHSTEKKYISSPINFVKKLKYVEFLNTEPTYQSDSAVDNILSWGGRNAG